MVVFIISALIYCTINLNMFSIKYMVSTTLQWYEGTDSLSSSSNVLNISKSFSSGRDKVTTTLQWYRGTDSLWSSSSIRNIFKHFTSGRDTVNNSNKALLWFIHGGSDIFFLSHMMMMAISLLVDHVLLLMMYVYNLRHVQLENVFLVMYV